MNVPGIFCTRKTAGKLVQKILNVLAMYQMGISQEHCPFTCSVFAMYQTGKLSFVPSVRTFTIEIKILGVCHLLDCNADLLSDGRSMDSQENSPNVPSVPGRGGDEMMLAPTPIPCECRSSQSADTT